MPYFGIAWLESKQEMKLIYVHLAKVNFCFCEGFHLHSRHPAWEVVPGYTLSGFSLRSEQHEVVRKQPLFLTSIRLVIWSDGAESSN